MNSSATSPRGGWVRYALLAALSVGGAAGGLSLSGAWPGTAAAPTGAADPGRPEVAAGRLLTHRFPLTALDAKDQIEAASLAADAAGRVFLAWASRTGKAERTVF